MNITIVGRKVNLRQSFKNYAERKLAKLDKFFNDDATLNLTVTVEKNYHKVEITIYDAGMIFRAEQEADEMEEALDIAVDAVVRQIRKNKTRLQRCLRSGAFAEDDPYVDKNYENEIIRHKEIELKPVTVDEAIMQMELLGHMFYMFKDAGTDQIGIVYRRNDGGYGVIQAV